MTKTTVLIVEDEAIVAADLAGKLRQLGYEVVGTTGKGEEAVELALRLKPAVVLMDIRLRGPMDGIEAADAILCRHDLPVIYLTAHSDAATLERAKLSGPFGYILKPFEERELATTIEMALYKHQSERQLREQRELLRVTLASIGDAVITCDTDARVTFLNPVAELLTGWKSEDAWERPIREVFQLINEQTRLPPEDPVALVLREGRAKALANHTALVTRDGREIPIEDSAAPILAADGRVIGVVLVFHDVTGKRRAQEALRRSHDELESCVAERTGELKELNDTLEERIIERTAQLNFANETLRAARVAALNLMEDAVIARQKAENVSVELLREATSRKQSEEQLRLFIEHAPAALAMFDRDMRYLSVSRRWLSDYYLSDRELFGMSHYELFPGVPERWKAIHRRALAGEVVRADNDRFSRSDGSVQWLRWEVRPWYDTSGDVAGIVVFSEDITEWQRAEQERETTVEFLRLVNESSTTRDLIEAAICFFQGKSGCEAVAVRLREGEDYPYFQICGFPGKFVEEERSLCARTGDGEIVRDSEGNPIIECMCGKVICEHFDPSKPYFSPTGSFWTNSTTELLAGASEAERQNFARNSCSDEGYESMALIPLFFGAERMGLVQLNDHRSGMFTAEVIALWERLAGYMAMALAKFRTEDELRCSKDVAEAANRAKSQFLANMSHELRTPMTGVLGMLDLALGGSLAAEQRDYLETAHKSARALLHILNEILDLSSVESGKLSIVAKPFSLRKCLADSLEIFNTEAHRKGLELISSLADDLPQSVVGDPLRLRQVLVNLIGNALKFTEQGKVEVAVTSGNRTPEGRGELTFTVSDTGIGIPRDKRHLLFHSFSQVDDSNTRSYGGSGLGLAICQEIVTRMGGTIGCESEQGKGSSFFFTVPFGEAGTVCEADEVPESSRSMTSNALDQAESRKSRLLIAEDEPVIRQLLDVMLRLSNFEPEFAEDGHMAVEMWDQGEYDLVLMDVQMPRMDGFSATRAIRVREKERGGGHTLIVAMTAHAYREDENRCLDAGMDAFISKPIDLQKSIELINGLISQRNCVLTEKAV